jgi:hypothetical protein
MQLHRGNALVLHQGFTLRRSSHARSSEASNVNTASF